MNAQGAKTNYSFTSALNMNFQLELVWKDTNHLGKVVQREESVHKMPDESKTLGCYVGLMSPFDLLLQELQELIIRGAGFCAVLHHVLEEQVTHLAVLSQDKEANSTRS